MGRLIIPPPPARRRDAVRADGDYGVSDQPDWRDVDWGEHLRTMDVGGVPVNYVDIGEQGDHRPIVFVHGLSGQWQNWLENIPRFAQQRRVVALDLPGFGRTPMPSEKITIDYYGRVVAELCDRLDLAPAVLVGNSMGGYVAAEAAIDEPELVERLMLVSAAGISQSELPLGRVMRAGKILALAMRASTAQRRRQMARPALRHWTLSMIVRHPTRLRPDIAFEGLVKGSGKPGFVDALGACVDYDFRDRLPEVGCPTLVVWGRDDAVIPVADADTYVELIPGSRKLIFEDTGHVAMVERPIAFNDELERFLELRDSPDPAPASSETLV
ncbi:MAG TPA: alpha/beta fold hydrolase [Thermoleophilaceae bacterium]|nr:alpha/beta fold hydrolase [Thermoleophilaceae bacterium]